MTFPRASSLVLALGGAFWAFVLLSLTLSWLQHSAGALVFLLFWLPGFLAWYGYVRRAFGHYLFRRARATWLLSIAANGWSLILLQGSPVSIIAHAWTLLALLLSFVCLVKEWRARELAPEVAANVTSDEFRKLLDEHRRKQR